MIRVRNKENLTMSGTASVHWNQETKNRLNEKVSINIHDLGSLAKYAVKTSRSSELLAQAAKNFSFQESVIQSSNESLKKMANIKSQLEHQYSAIEKSLLTGGAATGKVGHREYPPLTNFVFRPDAYRDKLNA